MNRDHPYVTASSIVPEARRLIRDTGASILPVVDEDSGRLLGVVNKFDLVLMASTRMSTKVTRVMSQATILLKPNEDVIQAAKRMIEYDVNFTPVVDDDNRYLGVFSLEDFIGWILDTDIDAVDSPLGLLMTSIELAARPWDPLGRIVQAMVSRRISSIPVIDYKGHILGVVSCHDLIARGSSRAWRHGAPKIIDFMTRPAITFLPTHPAFEAMQCIVTRRIARIFITDREKGRVVGQVSRRILAEAYLKVKRLA